MDSSALVLIIFMPCPASALSAARPQPQFRAMLSSHAPNYFQTQPPPSHPASATLPSVACNHQPEPCSSPSAQPAAPSLTWPFFPHASSDYRCLWHFHTQNPPVQLLDFYLPSLFMSQEGSLSMHIRQEARSHIGYISRSSSATTSVGQWPVRWLHFEQLSMCCRLDSAGSQIRPVAVRPSSSTLSHPRSTPGFFFCGFYFATRRPNAPATTG